jgi:hypothetical protein
MSQYFDTGVWGSIIVLQEATHGNWYASGIRH